MELDDLLKRRSDLVAERNGLLQRAQEEESERPESLFPAEMRATADAIVPKIVIINTVELAPLKKRIQDAYNDASHDRLARVTLKRLLARAVEALRQFGAEGEISRKAALFPLNTQPTTKHPKPTRNSHSKWIKNRGQANMNYSRN